MVTDVLLPKRRCDGAFDSALPFDRGKNAPEDLSFNSITSAVFFFSECGSAKPGNNTVTDRHLNRFIESQNPSKRHCETAVWANCIEPR